MSDEEIKNFLNSLSPSNRKMLEDFDKKILETQDKSLEYFLSKLEKGESPFDAEMWQLEKFKTVALMKNDPDNLRHVLIAYSNSLSKKYNEHLRAEAKLKEAKK